VRPGFASFRQVDPGVDLPSGPRESCAQLAAAEWRHRRGLRFVAPAQFLARLPARQIGTGFVRFRKVPPRAPQSVSSSRGIFLRQRLDLFRDALPHIACSYFAEGPRFAPGRPRDPDGRRPALHRYRY